MMKFNQPYKDNRSNFQIFLSKMYDRYLDEKQFYKEKDILNQYEYHRQYRDFLHWKYNNRSNI